MRYKEAGYGKSRKKKCNERIYGAAEKYGIYHWQIADLLGMRADAFSKKLRYELPEDEQELIVEIIKKHCKEVKNNE